MADNAEYALLLKSHPPERARELLSQRYSLFGDQKPILVLHSSAQQLEKQRLERQELLKAKHRTKLHKKNAKTRRKSVANAALAELLENADTNYSSYDGLRQLWQGYIDDVLRPLKGDPVKCANAMLISDWHGAEIRVVASRCPSYVGVSGTLLWEARSQMLFVTRDNKLRVVPKRGCLFRFETVEPVLELVGSRLVCRSAERTTRKFKPRNVDDIADFFV